MYLVQGVEIYFIQAKIFWIQRKNYRVGTANED